MLACEAVEEPRRRGALVGELVSPHPDLSGEVVLRRLERRARRLERPSPLADERVEIEGLGRHAISLNTPGADRVGVFQQTLARIVRTRHPTGHRPRARRASVGVMNADGTQLRRLTPRSMDASNPRWSRDGTRIAFNDYAEDVPNKSANVYTIRTDGTSLRKVTHYSGGTKRAFVNDWSPDGRQIVYHLISAAINDLYVVNADGTNTHALTHLGPKANPRHSTWGTAH